FLDLGPVVGPQDVDALLHDLLGGTGAGGDQDGVHPVEPFRADLGGAVDEEGRATQRCGDLGQAAAVRAILAAHDQHQVGPRGQVPDGILAVLGGVADVI